MTAPRISLCCITGNEAMHVVRFLDSFKEAFDELCLVRAMGNQEHDKTLSIAKEWCGKNGKGFVFSTYDNAGDAVPFGTPLDDNNPATWAHVDDFAAARNAAWDLATGDWQFWADIDDVLAEGAEMIRYGASIDKYDVYYFKYALRTSSESNFRERMFRAGTSRWSQPVHENCHLINQMAPRGCYEPKVVYSHDPLAEKVRDPMRNTRIMRYHLRHLTGFAYGLHQEALYRWQAKKEKTDREEALKWAGIAQACDIADPTRLQILLNLSEIAGADDPAWGLDYAWQALRQAPQIRDTWGRVAELELASGKDMNRAALASEIMQVMPKATESGFPASQRFYGHEGLLLRTRTLRACGREDAARKSETKIFEANGKRFSLLHATRGRPAKALETRALFFAAAFRALGIEHIFAIDADDPESIEALKHYRHVIVKEPRGCVKAWNAAAAASSGHVLVQLSDDWLPCNDWDELCWLMLKEDGELKCGKETEVGSVPQVLAVSDGTRRDTLLCMAILTRARYEQQNDSWVEIEFNPDLTPRTTAGQYRPSYLFHPDYFGVFSDNEFTMRAHADKVVVAAPHIEFRHEHPIFKGIPTEEWDATYRRQNMPERYKEGMEIFNRRNPKWAIKLQ